MSLAVASLAVGRSCCCPESSAAPPDAAPTGPAGGAAPPASAAAASLAAPSTSAAGASAAGASAAGVPAAGASAATAALPSSALASAAVPSPCAGAPAAAASAGPGEGGSGLKGSGLDGGWPAPPALPAARLASSWRSAAICCSDMRTTRGMRLGSARRSWSAEGAGTTSAVPAARFCAGTCARREEGGHGMGSVGCPTLPACLPHRPSSSAPGAAATAALPRAPGPQRSRASRRLWHLSCDA